MAGFTRCRRQEHSCSQLANGGPQSVQQAAERTTELEAPATPESLNDLGDGPIETRADTAPRVYVDILERNGR